MPRFVLIDVELDEIVGDTDRYFLQYLRAVASATGDPLPAAIDITPKRAAEVFDLVTGDDIGWRYVEWPDVGPNGGPGYEVYEVPTAHADRICPETGDPAAVAMIRRSMRRVAFVEKALH